MRESRPVGEAMARGDEDIRLAIEAKEPADRAAADGTLDIVPVFPTPDLVRVEGNEDVGLRPVSDDGRLESLRGHTVQNGL